MFKRQVPLKHSAIKDTPHINNSVSTSNCLWRLRVRPGGVEIDPLSVGELILELL